MNYGIDAMAMAIRCQELWIAWVKKHRGCTVYMVILCTINTDENNTSICSSQCPLSMVYICDL